MRTLFLAAILLAAPVAAADVPKTRTPIAGPDQGQDSGAAREIIALIDRLSQAMQAHHTATLGKLVMPDGIVVDTRENPDGSTKVGRHTLSEWVTLVGAIKQPLKERIGRPDLTIAGPAASKFCSVRWSGRLGSRQSVAAAACTGTS